MRVHVFQHVPFEGLGNLETLLARRRARVTWTRFHRGDGIPPLEGIDLLIALGGPMSVNDEVSFPWLVEEKHSIARAVAAGTPVLGICLGAQLIASAHGARVYPAAETEIGWFPVIGEPVGPDAFAFPPHTPVFHWHGETFDLPGGAVLLATSAGCRNQAFQLGPRVIGVQFHPESTPRSAGSIARHCADEIGPGRFVQPGGGMQDVPPALYEELERCMQDLLAYLLRDR